MKDFYIKYNAAEIQAAQAALNLYPSDSAYWNCHAGQRTLEIINILDLTPANSDSERRQLYEATIKAAFKQAAFEAA